jgi:flagellar motor switch protein FliN
MDDQNGGGNPGADATANGPFGQVPIEVMISVGKAHPLIGELLSLGNNSILTLDQKVSDPVELYVGSKLIARGELQEIEGDTEGQLAVRLTEVAPLKNGL